MKGILPKVYQWDFSYSTECPTVTNRIQLFNFFFLANKIFNFKIMLLQDLSIKRGLLCASKGNSEDNDTTQKNDHHSDAEKNENDPSNHT